jgi:hypothetical protein
MTTTTTTPAPEAAAAPDEAVAPTPAPPAPDGTALLAAACEALRTARRTVRAEALADSTESQDATEIRRRRDQPRPRVRRGDWPAACADQLARELERSDPDDAVIAALRAAMFAPFAS